VFSRHTAQPGSARASRKSKKLLVRFISLSQSSPAKSLYPSYAHVTDAISSRGPYHISNMSKCNCVAARLIIEIVTSTCQPSNRLSYPEAKQKSGRSFLPLENGNRNRPDAIIYAMPTDSAQNKAGRLAPQDPMHTRRSERGVIVG
jgi:hypothetical protein